MEVEESVSNGSSWHNVSDYFLFVLILSNPFLSEGDQTVWVKERSQSMMPALQNVTDHFFLLFFIVFSSEGHQTVQVKVEESTDDRSSWENASDHFLFTASL